MILLYIMNVFQKHYDELKWLYCELYRDRDDVMTYLHDLPSNMEAFYNSRNSALKASDKSVRLIRTGINAMTL